ncbi:helix-turn-helix transcriptional regulator [Actinomadura vinacea]|uniref:Helix-turn-helix transcriptional regulator n=1 Tax=Actinomadura vinacea TaxID=115336 RepID=A0ABN3IPA2_9ACTN
MAKPLPSTARRRKIGRVLRQIREDAGLTLNAAGRSMERSGSSLSLIEKGIQQLRLRDLKHILDVYDVAPDTRAALMTLAEQQQQLGWWEEFKDTISPAARDYASLESNATHLDAYEMGFIPGLLQTEDYARVVMHAGQVENNPAQAERFVVYRMARQQILDRTRTPRLHVVIDEAALRRKRGRRQVMQEQLVKLIEQSRRDDISLQVLPFDVESDPGDVTSFQILDIGRPAVLSTVLIDHLTGSWFMEEESIIAAYRASFRRLSAAALGELDSQKLVQRIVSDL